MNKAQLKPKRDRDDAKPVISWIGFTKKRVVEKELQKSADEILAHFKRAHLFIDEDGYYEFHIKRHTTRKDLTYIKTYQ